MITFRHRPHNRAKAYTLVELLIAAGLSGIILTGVLATILMIMRSGVRTENYFAMEKETRQAFEQLGLDARGTKAFSSTFNSSGAVQSFTLTIPMSNGSGDYSITYGYDSANKLIYRVPGSNPSETTGRKTLINNVSQFSFARYDGSSTAITTSSNAGIKHIQISVTVARSGSGGVVRASQTIRSSAFTLRNI
jgi:type II secretory pathway pseudopilin PulG